jgi:hypothetical protein
MKSNPTLYWLTKGKRRKNLCTRASASRGVLIRGRKILTTSLGRSNRAYQR